MYETRGVAWARVRVTAVTVAALAILLVLVLLLSGGTIFQQQATLYLFVPDATGLEAGADVRVDGINVGTTASVGLSHSNQPDRAVRLVLHIRQQRLSSISSDSTAELTADSLVGDKFVDITGGTSPSHIVAGGEIHYKASPDLMKSLDLTQFQEQLRIVDATLRDMEEGRGPVGQFVQSDKLYNDLTKQFAKLESEIRSASSTTGRVGSVLYTAQQYQQIDDPLRKLDASLARMQSAPLLRDTGQYEQFVDAARSLRKSLADVHDGQLFQSGDLYTEWAQRLAELARTVDAFNSSPAFTSTQMYDNLAGMSSNLAAFIHDLRTNPRKYLVLKVF